MLFNNSIQSKTLIIALVFSLCSVLSGLNMDANASSSKISQSSINFLEKTGNAMAEIAEAVKPSVVNVSTEKTEKIASAPISPFSNNPLFKQFFGNQFRQQAPRERKSASLGSGVIISSDGYILTNNHVIKNADKIKVLLSDKREFIGKLVGADPKTDLAVIKIEAEGLSSIEIGDSDKLKIGELVLAVGNPFGLNQTITMGIVSAVGRANVGIADYEDFIQTDAAINPGNSGGALVNIRGELVGINTAIFTTSGGYQGIGFAIPSNMIKVVMDSLISGGKVIRGWLGVSVQPMTPELAQQFGLEKEQGTLISNVIENSPAELAGLLRGDFIIEFNGKKVNEPFVLKNTVAETKPGDEVDIKIIRDGKIETFKVVIGELPDDIQKVPATAFENALKGVSIRDLTPEIYDKLNLPEKIRGVVVTNIAPGSPAETSLAPGDVILEVNRKGITNVDDYEARVSKIKPDRDILLLIFRRGSTIFATISGK
ncbi:MAG TPA: DegQ family serine endoprotease [Nitrospirae bacterium]|nr:putative periplasmic serine endoprotease DegP-like precursor [bacterium BMS3Abin09]GBE40451.1 putative periplasmic serine endoprotease DegP-like precursor [bacterium BMS3Bbin09]HDZ84611.1 DegQ family serine endoprotease [Nitrospirota bacterium]